MPPPGEPRNIRLQGPGWQPPGYDTAPLEARRWYWKTLGDIAHEIKREEISRGIGISGRPLKPIIQKYRKDGATGPPLIPHEFESRTQRLLAIHVMVDGVTLFWRGHGRQSWATILGYHAYKHGPRALPVRNTIGISRGGMTKIRARAFAAWRARAKAEPPPAPPEPPPKPPRVPKPRPVPKPPPAPKPKGEYYGYKVHTELPKRIKKAIVFSGGKAKPPPAPPPKPPAPPKPKPPPPPPKPPKPVPPPKPPAPPPPPARLTPIESATAWAQSKGVPVRVADAADFRQHYGPDEGDKVFARYSIRNDEVIINEGHPAWRDMETHMANMRDPKWMSTQHPEHIIRHEVGHALHARRIGTEEALFREDRWTNQQDYATARKVSNYATTNTAEFVAEVYAGLVAKRPFDDDVLKLYDKLEGPSV